MVKRATCTIFVALCLSMSGYGRNDLKQLVLGKWQRVGGSAKPKPCELQNWYDFHSDTTYTFYMACNNITETGMLSVNAENSTITMQPTNLELPFVCDVLSVNKKKLALRFGDIVYRYKKVR